MKSFFETRNGSPITGSNCGMLGILLFDRYDIGLKYT